MKRINKLIGAVIVSLIIINTQANAVNVTSLSKSFPPQTVALVEIKDFTELQNQFQKTNFYKSSYLKQVTTRPFCTKKRRNIAI